ncbi:MAG: hypothetical protein MJ126_06685 [Lachnospiraceae bacterium]|nr:hypothetical protein [Lachnospiraceae bacterium]
MGSVLLPISRKASKPFFIDRICAQIYSGEELLFYLGENPELLSKDIFSKDLIEWLREECSATELADTIEKQISSRSNVIQIVSALLAYASFISYDEKERILRVMKDGEGTSEFDKRKARGDFFLGKERYAYAIREYEALVAAEKDEESERIAAVYHNMGVAKARMFLFEQAGDDFLRAYDCDDNEEHYYAYIATLRFSLTDMEYVKKIGNDASMSSVTLKLESDLENAKNAFKESPDYLEFMNQKELSKENGRMSFCNYLSDKLNEKKEEYNKYVI